MAKKSTSKDEVIQEIFSKEIEQPKSALTGFTFKLFFLVFITALLGGFFAAFIRDNLLDIYGERFFLSADSVDKKYASDSKILDLDFLLKEQDNAYSEVLNKLRAQLVGFYKARPSSNNILDSLYLEKDFLGSGLVVTSDGWLVTHQSITDKASEIIAVSADRKIYSVKQKVADPFSGLTMLKIEASGLSPVKFADISGLPPTQPLIAARYSIQNHGSDLIKSYVRKFGYHDQGKGVDFLLSSDKIDRYLKMSEPFDLVYGGSGIFNEKNEIVGLLFNSGRENIDLAIPAYYIRSAVNNFLSSSSKILRVSLGVNYLDLSETLGLASDITESRMSGAVLIGDAKRSINAVSAGSPAEQAGLKAGDIILKVNNEEINERNSLTKLVQDYAPGREIVLIILRDGKEQEVKLTLSEL